MIQRAALLSYMEQHGSVTRAEAMTKLGVVELSSRLLELEGLGFKFNRQPVQVRNRYGRTVRVCRYSIAKYPKGWSNFGN